MAYLLQGPSTTENKTTTHRTHRTRSLSQSCVFRVCTNCTFCPAGMYRSSGCALVLNSRCTSCPQVSIASILFSRSSCLIFFWLDLQGTYSPSPGWQASCILCNRGKYAPSTNSSACLDCPAGTHAPEQAHTHAGLPGPAPQAHTPQWLSRGSHTANSAVQALTLNWTECKTLSWIFLPAPLYMQEHACVSGVYRFLCGHHFNMLLSSPLLQSLCILCFLCMVGSFSTTFKLTAAAPTNHST